MLVTAEDFKLLPYNIPNLSEYGDSFPDFVEQEEELVLNTILGRLLAGKFMDVMDVADPEARWKDLRDGVVYTSCGVKYKFDGLKKAMRPYIYYLWTSRNLEHDTGIGLVASDAENAVKVSPALKLSRAYNDYARKIGSYKHLEDSLYGYLYNSGDIYLADIAEYDYSSIKNYICDYFKAPRFQNPFGL